MSDLAFEISFWHWFILAGVLIVVEIAAPGVVFLWIGIAAAVTGFALMIFSGMAWELQLVLFGILSVLAAIGGRQFVKQKPIATDHPTLNLKGQQYVGRSLKLDEAIVNGSGRTAVDDSTWRVEGPDLEKGAQVTVVGVVGNALQVEAVKD